MAVTAKRPFVVSRITVSFKTKQSQSATTYPTKQLKYTQFLTVLLGYPPKDPRVITFYD